MIRDKYILKQVMEIILYIFIGVLLCFILPITSGFSFGGFEKSISTGLINISDYLGTYLVYLFFIIGAMFVIIFPIVNLITIRKGEHPATQEKPKWYRIFSVSCLFNPEDGALWQLSESLGFKGKKNIMRWSANILLVILVSILVFGGLGILQVMNPKLNVVGVPPQSQLQQVSTTSDIIFGSGIPSFAENGILFFILFTFLGINAYLCARFIKDKKMALTVFFIIALLIISPCVGVIWMSWHSLVYGNSEASLFATFIFGWLGSAITIILFSFIPWLVWHFMNNFFIKLSEFVTLKEDIIFVALVLWIVLFLITVTWIGVRMYLRKKRGISTET